jgi:cytoskeletal protein CcmA (bactofilin family)
MFGGRKPTSTPQTGSTVTSGTNNPANQPTSQSGQSTPVQIPRQQVGYETIIGPNTTLKGELKSNASIRVDGAFEGIVEAEGNVMIGEPAKIIANVNGKNITVSGAVRGNLHGQKVHLTRTGRVWGDITATALTTEEGAYIDGKITMIGHPAGMQGFSSLPAPEISILPPMAEDAISGEPVEAEMVDDEPKPPQEDQS